MADSRNQLINSPDVRLGPGVVAKRPSKYGNQQTIEESSDDVDTISDEKNLINQNIKQYQSGVAFNNFIMRREGPTSHSSSLNYGPMGFNKKPAPMQETKVQQKKAFNVQNNLLDFLKKNTPEPNVQFTLSNHEKKVNAVKNTLKDMEKPSNLSNSNYHMTNSGSTSNNSFGLSRVSPKNSEKNEQ